MDTHRLLDGCEMVLAKMGSAAEATNRKPAVLDNARQRSCHHAAPAKTDASLALLICTVYTRCSYTASLTGSVSQSSLEAEGTRYTGRNARADPLAAWQQPNGMTEWRPCLHPERAQRHPEGADREAHVMSCQGPEY